MNARKILKEIKSDGRYIERRLLKPCPFCGGKAKMERGEHSRPEEGFGYYIIKCEECGAFVSGKSRNTYREHIGKATFSVVDKWNRRTGEAE